MLLHCAQCLSELKVDQSGWQCPTHGDVVTAFTPEGKEVSAELLATVRVTRSARQAVSPHSQPLVKRCRICHKEFEARNPRHRYCPEHVGELQSRLARAK